MRMPLAACLVATAPATCLVPVWPRARVAYGAPEMASRQGAVRLPHFVRRAHVSCCEPGMASQQLEAENTRLRARIDELEEQLGRTEGLCEVLDSGADFNDSLRSRASWLLGLLICQSGSSFILEGNEALIQSHPVIVYFMTMLVGAGGNAGNQASVRIIRGLATGEVNPVSERSFVASEARMAVALSVIVVTAGFVRVVAFDATTTDAVAISLALFLIVGSSILLGTVLPLLLNRLRVDAAHASTTIQVIMDVLGVTIACTVTPLVYAMAAGGGWSLPALMTALHLPAGI